MNTISRALVAPSVFALVAAAAGAAHAWEPVPGDPRYQTTVTRVVDVARAESGPVIALAEPPLPACTALAASMLMHVSALYNESWVRLRPTEGAVGPASEMLAIVLAARAQNLEVRVTLARNNIGGAGDCIVADLRTCTDQAACALPPAP